MSIIDPIGAVKVNRIFPVLPSNQKEAAVCGGGDVITCAGVDTLTDVSVISRGIIYTDAAEFGNSTLHVAALPCALGGVQISTCKIFAAWKIALPRTAVDAETPAAHMIVLSAIDVAESVVEVNRYW